MAFGVVDEIVDDEVVFHIAHAADGGKLIFQPVAVFLGRVFAVVAQQTLVAHAAKVAFVILAIGGIEQRQLGVAKLKLDIAALGDLDGIGEGFRHIAEELGHLIPAFDIELLGGEFQRLLIIDGVAGLDAGEQKLHAAVLFFEVVGVIGGHQPHAELPGQADEIREDLPLLRDTVVLQLDVVIFRAEEIAVPGGGLPGLLVIAGLQCPGHFARQARRKADEALVVVL